MFKALCKRLFGKARPEPETPCPGSTLYLDASGMDLIYLQSELDRIGADYSLSYVNVPSPRYTITLADAELRQRVMDVIDEASQKANEKAARGTDGQ